MERGEVLDETAVRDLPRRRSDRGDDPDHIVTVVGISLRRDACR